MQRSILPGMRQLVRCIPFILLLAGTACQLMAQGNPYLPPAPPPVPSPRTIAPPGTSVTTLPPALPCLGCYAGFRFDDTFHIGAHFNGNWPHAMRYAKDTLHIETTQYYLGLTNLRHYLDSAQWAASGRDRYFDSLYRNFYRDIDSSGMKIIYGPGAIPFIVLDAQLYP